MNISQEGINLIKEFEGVRLTAYRDPVGILTIGYGHTGGVLEGQVISMAEAETILKQDLVRFESAVNRLVKVPLTQSQFDSLVSFSFNLGEGALQQSDLLTKLNRGDYVGASAEFPRWVHAGGQILGGLVRRREAERKLFDKQGQTQTTTGKQTIKVIGLADDSKVKYVPEFQKKYSGLLLANNIKGYDKGGIELINIPNGKRDIIHSSLINDFKIPMTQIKKLGDNEIKVFGLDDNTQAKWVVEFQKKYSGLYLSDDINGNNHQTVEIKTDDKYVDIIKKSLIEDFKIPSNQVK